MSKEMLVRLGRRTLVLAATLAVIGVAAATVQVAAEWRAEAAPLDVAPAGMTTISADFATETERSQDLANQIDGVAGQISDLQAALITANGSIQGDTQSATDLQDQLAAAKTKLTALQKQLKAAQTRLEQLNAAAARQAALNRSAASQSKTRSSGGAAPATRTPEPKDHDDD